MDGSAQPQRPGVGTLLGLAWPIMVSRSTQVVVGLSDCYLVTRLGKDAFAATSTGSINAFAVMVGFMGTVFIVSSFASQMFGRGDPVGARRFAFYGLALAGITELVCLLARPVVPLILAHTDYTPQVRELMEQYLVVRLWSGGAVIGMEALANYYGGIGRTRLPMIASVIAMVLNVFLNIALINGKWGAPALGVKGSALASTLATTIAFVLLVGIFAYEGRKFPWPQLRFEEFKRVLRFGLPSGVNWFLEFFAYNFWVNVVVGSLGTVAVGAMMAVIQVNSFSFMPAFGLASGGAILVGQAIGAGRKDDVPALVSMTFRTAAIWQGLVGFAYLLLPTLLLTPLAPADAVQDFLEVGARILMLSAGWQLFDAAVNTTGEALRAAGDTSYLLKARLTVAWAIFVPGAYVSVKYLGWREVGAAFWLVTYLVVLAVALFVRFRSGKWRELQLIDPAVG